MCGLAAKKTKGFGRSHPASYGWLSGSDLDSQDRGSRRVSTGVDVQQAYLESMVWTMRSGLKGTASQSLFR